MLIEERANENRETTVVLSYSNRRQQADSCDSSALRKKMVQLINLLGKGLTQEINGDGGSILWAPVRVQRHTLLGEVQVGSCSVSNRRNTVRMS